MTFDEHLADRVRNALGSPPGLTERTMFGGLAFMVDGHLCCGVLDDTLMARIGPDAYEEALDEPYVRPMDFTGRPMRGLVFIDPPGLKTADALQNWVDRTLAFVESLPPK